MANGPVSFNDAETAAAIAEWTAYADLVERHGASNPAMLTRLRAVLGDTYADFVDAKLLEQQQRTGAYQRLAAQARAHAQKLANTRANFARADEVNQTNFDAVNVD